LAPFAGLRCCANQELEAFGMDRSRFRQFWKQTLALVNRIALWSDRHLPPGVRAGLGVVAMMCGLVGFLPIVGFWMLPLGIVLVALDIPPLRRRVLDWLARQQSRQQSGTRCIDRRPP
jgi:hypothetical protein